MYSPWLFVNAVLTPKLRDKFVVKASIGVNKKIVNSEGILGMEVYGDLGYV